MVVDQLEKVRLCVWARVLLRLELWYELAGFIARARIRGSLCARFRVGVESV